MPPKVSGRPALVTADDLTNNRARYGAHHEWEHAIRTAHRAMWIVMRDMVDIAEGEGRDLKADEQRDWDKLEVQLAALDELRHAEEIDRSQIISTSGGGSVDADGRPSLISGVPGGMRPGLASAADLSPWSQLALTGVRGAMDTGQGARSLRTGSVQVRCPLLPRGEHDQHRIDRRDGTGLPEPQRVPLDGSMAQLLDTGRIPEFPTRIVDLLVDRKPLTDSNTFSYLVQTLRDNNAAPVADQAQKPVSRFAYEDREDRVRVIAHLSEPLPLRFFDDEAELLRFLQSEMENGLLDALEEQVVSGNGQGENLRGLVNTTGRFVQPWDTSIERTLRKARTKLKVAAESPTAWVVHPEQTEAIDLLREGADGAFLNGQFSSSVMGSLPIVESIAVDPETALLADWRLMQLVIRDAARLDVDLSGELFHTNQCQLRLEGRYGFAVRRTTALAVVDLSG